jgi:hypothetical protein
MHMLRILVPLAIRADGIGDEGGSKTGGES